MKKKKSIIISIIMTLISFLCIIITILGLVSSDENMNSKQGLPDIHDCVLDFNGYDVNNKYLKQHMKGTYEFFYNHWIIEEKYKEEADAIVSVPHHYLDTSINENKLSSEGYASYRMYITGLPIGTDIHFINSNFLGGVYGYINSNLIYRYGTRNKTGDCSSNGGAEYNKSYIVEDNNPLEVVFEVSSSRRGGLSSPFRLVIESQTNDPTSPSLTNNIGFVILGFTLSLFIFSFIINIGVSKRNLIFPIIMFFVTLITIFSIDVYWRLLSFLRWNTYNYILDFNLFLFIGLLFLLLYHLINSKRINFSKVFTTLLGVLSILSIILFYSLQGSSLQIISFIILISCYLLLVYPLCLNFYYSNKINILYIIFIISLSMYGISSFFDLEDIMIAGLEQTVSWMMLPMILCVIVLYRLVTLEHSKRLIQALQVEKEHNLIKSEALKSQIKPHFIFNSLSSIQAAYHKDLTLGDELLTKFSKHLRINVDSSIIEKIPFKEELDHILNYIDIENLRREKPINVLLDCAIDDFILPPLSLQPFIENAFKYSHVEDKENGYVQLKTFKDKHHYFVLIQDNGIGFDLKNIKPTSIGLKNATERLKLILNANITINSKINQGTKILIQFSKNKEDN